MQFLRSILVLSIVTLFHSVLAAQEVQENVPTIQVSHDNGVWIIEGKKQKLTLDERSLSLKIETGSVTWQLAASGEDDMRIKHKGEEFDLELASAGRIAIEAYQTGYKTGVKIRLSEFRGKGMYHPEAALDLNLILTIALEEGSEDLISTATAIENEAKVRQLDWPKELITRAVPTDYTVLPHVRGNLLPGNWPEEYHPFGSNVPSADQTSFAATETSYIQSNLIETWSMSWWGFQRENAAMMLIIETPDDAAYRFNHPEGGPTVIGPRWLGSLGELAYPRSVRLCFFTQGNYVDMAKKYREYVKNTGHFVSLKEKIARQPLVAKLIGTPHERLHILRNYRKGSRRYNAGNPTENYRLTTFEESARQLRELKTNGINMVYVTLAGWPKLGYDREHPNVLPPAPEAGGWPGLKKWFDTVNELGYIATLHDQYRDYYTDAPSFDPQFAIHEEDAISPPTVFPGTRFGTWKEGHLPFMDYWDGGKMTYLNPQFALGHFKKNYQTILQHEIKPDGSYLDVFGYVPPTQDFNPEHPLTRRDNMYYRALMFTWARNNLGIVGTEDGADWVIPYVDYATQANEGATISVPLYNLVYHDAIMTPSGGTNDFLRCLLNGGFPTVPNDIKDSEALEKMRIISALHKRIALLEMIDHQFLDKEYKKERTTFSDGTTVSIDREAGTFQIDPELTY